MKINPAPLHMAQAIIIGLVCALSIATLGTSAHTLDVFNKQQSSNPWWLPLWPDHFDVHGTKALVGASTTTFVLSAVFLVMALVPHFKLTQKYTTRALLALATTLPSALVTLVTVIYVHILNHDSPEMDTIQTWTCKYKNDQPVEQQTVELPSGMGNGAFKSLCSESKFAVYGMLVVFLLLGLSMALTVVTWLADKWSARSSNKEVEMTAQHA
jgi:hypothetical protein